MTNVTATQCNHWRIMFPRRDAVLAWMRQWYSECRCIPTMMDFRTIFGVWPTSKYFIQARAVVKLEAKR